MANNENLKPIKPGELSKEELKKRQSNGGKKSGEVRRAKKTMKEVLDYLLTKEITNKSGEKKTTIEAICVAQIAQALQGNTKAFKEIRDTIGEMPVQEIRNITPPTIIDDV